MRSKSPKGSRYGTLLTFCALAFAAALFVTPAFFISEAQNSSKSNGKGSNALNTAQDDDLKNYDIRRDKGAHQKIADLRARFGKSASDVADLRDRFARAEEELKGRVRNLRVEWEPNQSRPEVIAPDVSQGKGVLARNFGRSRAETVRSFVAENADLFGIAQHDLGQLETSADYQNPEGGMSFVRLRQKINGIPVFAGEVRAGFSSKGELVRLVNGLAAGIGNDAPTNFGDPARAVEIALENVGGRSQGKEHRAEFDEKNTNKVRFGQTDFSSTAEKTYFQTEPGVVIPAWEVLVWEPVNAYYLVVEAETGEVLWRKNITSDQTQAATYSVYANPNSMINVAENPAPLTPGPISPSLGTQGILSNRTSITLVGNEAPYTFNSLGWINDNNNFTDGNNVQAGPDRDCLINQTTGQCTTVPGDTVALPNQGVDSPITGSAFRNFTYDYDPAPGNPAPGSEPLSPGSVPGGCTLTPAVTEFQKGAATQLFYITNRYHDEMYRLGFTEAAGNFQHNNFGRGGLGNDRVSAESQDCTGASNANFSTPPDGTRGRMQMYIFSGPTPGRDGSLDADIVIHELTHGLSNRLHGNAAGLATNMAGGMGEGWGDFYAHAMLSEPTDPINGIYPSGGYATYSSVLPDNYYYGVRRFPKAVMAFTGGPNNRPHNPLTFADIDSTKMNLNDGAFPPQFIGSADQVHAAGEVWSTMLWEVRAKFVTRLGWTVGNRRILQFVTDGMKLSPINPTFVTGRDAIVAAALASGTAEDVRDIWEGFAIRGLGASASVTDPGTGGGTARVVEAFDLPNLTQSPDISVSDSTGDNDGFAEPGETVMITVPLTNKTGNTATNVSATIVGGSTIAYGTIANNGTASNQFRHTLPTNVACGAVLDITINVTSSLGPVSFTKRLILGTPTSSLTQNFDGAAAPNFPAGWTAAVELGGITFVNSILSPDTVPNSAFAQEPSKDGGGTTLTSPAIPIQSSAAQVSFRHKWNTEEGWDGGVLEVKIGDGAFQDIVTAGGGFLENGYNGSLGSYENDNNPIGDRDAWTGNSNGYVTTRAYLPASAAGKEIQLRWRFGADNNTTAPGANPGWYVDTISVIGQYTCSAFSTGNVRSDFDGDGRTDMSVYRPQTGVWYMLGSTRGVFAYQFGGASDLPVPADYDKDGTTDVAVYRPGQQSVFWVLRSNGFTVSSYSWGTNGDLPVVRDYDGDKAADVAVYRPSTGAWYVLNSSGGGFAVGYGQPGDVAVAGDFDGDGKGDQTVYRNGSWFTLKSSGGTSFFSWGTATDKPVPADYDGDGKDDVAVYRPSSGAWYVIRSSDSGVTAVEWGAPGDQPIPGDYDGDRKADFAIYRSGDWWILNSTGGITAAQFGVATDKPTPQSYIP